MTLAAGIDVGGTKCLGVVIDDSGNVVAERRRPTPDGGDALIDTLERVVDDLTADVGEVATLGIGVPGLVTLAGVLRASPNIANVAELDVAGRLGARLGRPIVVGTSRKSFIGKLTGAETDERLGGTIASNVLAYARGAEILRVHDVGPLREALTTAAAILDRGRAATIADRPLGPAVS